MRFLPALGLRARRCGYASLLTLPLRRDGVVIGVIDIYAAEGDAFDDEMRGLLAEAANEFALTIAHRRTEAKHGRTRAALRTAEAHFRAAAESSLDARGRQCSHRGPYRQRLRRGSPVLSGGADERPVGQTHRSGLLFTKLLCWLQANEVEAMPPCRLSFASALAAGSDPINASSPPQSV